MAAEESGGSLLRRVPGAARLGPDQPVKPVLSESVLNRMQAAIDAEHAQTEPEHNGDPNTEPLPRVTGSGSPSKRSGKRAPSPTGIGPDPEAPPDQAATSEKVVRLPRPAGLPAAEDPLRVAGALRAGEPAWSPAEPPNPAVPPAAPAPPVPPAASTPPVPPAAPAPPVPPAASAPPVPPAASAPPAPPVSESLAWWSDDPAEPHYPAQSPRAAEPPRAAGLPGATGFPGAAEPAGAAESRRGWRAAAPAPETQATPGSIGWLWPEETATRGGGGPRWQPPRRGAYRTALLALGGAVAVGAGVFLGIYLHSTTVAGAHSKSSAKATAGPAASARTAPSPTASPTAVPAELASSLTAAATWMSQELAPGTVVACDAQTCTVLTSSGLPTSQQVQVALNSQSLLSANVVLVTPVLRGLFETDPSLGNYVAPVVLASFGQVSIQPIDSAGAAAYQAALSQDVQARIQYGQQLLNSGFISASATAQRELVAGDVDSRVLLMLHAIAYQEPIDILAFGDSGPGASQAVPFRGVQVAEFDANAGVSRSAYLQVMQQVLTAQTTFPAYQKAGPVPLADGQNAIRIIYAAPSPLGLLTGG